MKGTIKKINYLLLILIVLCLFSDQSSAVSTLQSSPLSATEILKKVKKNYSSLTSYQDKGSVKQERGFVKFETYFSSPDSFLFKWEKTEKFYFPELKRSSIYTTKSAIKSNKEETYIFYYYEGDLESEVEKFHNLKSAISPATGISWGSALYIPSLIFQGINRAKLTNIREAKIVGVQYFGGKECFIISGKWLHINSKFTIWIEKDSFIIKKFTRDNSHIYLFEKVLINKKIPTATFEFVPE